MPLSKTTATKKVIIYTDGGSRGNPGPAGIGVIICDEKGNLLKKYSNYIGVSTNNEAEYQAVIFGLNKLKQLFGKDKLKKMLIELRIDSQLVARQLKGIYKIKEEKLFPLFIKIWNWKIDFPNLLIQEISRAKNKEADLLVNQAISQEVKD